MSIFSRHVMAVVVLVASSLTVSVGLGSNPTGAIPAVGSPAVDFGVIGVTDLETWGEFTLTLAGSPDPDVPLHLYLGLVSDRVGLDANSLSVSDPKSDNYGRYGLISEVADRFNASESTTESVAAWFDSRGVSLTLDPTRSYFEGEVPIAVAEEAFGVQYNAYSSVDLPADNLLYSPASAPTALAPGLDGKIDRVIGAVILFAATFVIQSSDTTTRLAEPSSVLSPTSIPGLAPADGGTPWRTGTMNDGCAEAADFNIGGHSLGLSPGQLRTAYGIDALWDSGMRGRGARIAVVDSSLYAPTDIAAFRSCFGLEGTPITDHVIGTPALDGGSDETTLDLEVIVSVAPEADRIDWFGVKIAVNALAGASSVFEMLNAPLDVTRTGGLQPDVITLSYGGCEAVMSGFDPAYLPMMDLLDQTMSTAVSSGIGVFASTGDTGSTGCFQFDGPPVGTSAAVQFPSTSPWITAVGGTNLTLAPDNRIASSGVWNDYSFGLRPSVGQPSVGGGGGGVSLFEERPVWQNATGMPQNANRMVPDISAFADELPGYLIVLDGNWTIVGGTSASTPLSATAFALQSVSARTRGEAGLGFVAPLLYDLARTDSGDTDNVLFDITLGTNDVNQIGVHSAAPGYDLATGLGSVMHDRLLQVLAARSKPVAPEFTG
jgi:subtilase family serine protease